MKHLPKYLSVVGIATGIILFAGSAMAADYEWIAWMTGTQSTGDSRCTAYGGCNFVNPGSDKDALIANTATNFAWGVSTTQSYTEYRSLYYYVTTTASWVPPQNWPTWTEITACRHSGSVAPPGGIDTCSATTTNTSVTSTIWYRASTEYGGCGTWSPTPSQIPDCGGIRQASSTFFPH